MEAPHQAQQQLEEEQEEEEQQQQQQPMVAQRYLGVLPVHGVGFQAVLDPGSDGQPLVLGTFPTAKGAAAVADEAARRLWGRGTRLNFPSRQVPLPPGFDLDAAMLRAGLVGRSGPGGGSSDVVRPPPCDGWEPPGLQGVVRRGYLSLGVAGVEHQGWGCVLI